MMSCFTTGLIRIRMLVCNFTVLKRFLTLFVATLYGSNLDMYMYPTLHGAYTYFNLGALTYQPVDASANCQQLEDT